MFVVLPARAFSVSHSYQTKSVDCLQGGVNHFSIILLMQNRRKEVTAAIVLHLERRTCVFNICANFYFHCAFGIQNMFCSAALWCGWVDLAIMQSLARGWLIEIVSGWQKWILWLLSFRWLETVSFHNYICETLHFCTVCLQQNITCWLGLHCNYKGYYIAHPTIASAWLEFYFIDLEMLWICCYNMNILVRLMLIFVD